MESKSNQKNLASQDIWEIKWFTNILFWGVSLSILTAIIILAANYQFYTFSLSKEGLSNFLELMSLPIGILTGTTIILGFIATIHRSKQAAESIKQTEQSLEHSNKLFKAQQAQNNFANYYKHKEEFDRFLEQKRKQLRSNLEESNCLNHYIIQLYQNNQVMYPLLFPNNSEAKGSILNKDAKEIPYIENTKNIYFKWKDTISKIYEDCYKLVYNFNSETCFQNYVIEEREEYINFKQNFNKLLLKLNQIRQDISSSLGFEIRKKHVSKNHTSEVQHSDYEWNFIAKVILDNISELLKFANYNHLLDSIKNDLEYLIYDSHKISTKYEFRTLKIPKGNTTTKYLAFGDQANIQKMENELLIQYDKYCERKRQL